MIKRLSIIAGIACLGFHPIQAQETPPNASLPVSIRWLAPGSDYLTRLTERPLERFQVDPDRQEDLILGHLAFRYAGSLAGQAMRQELSCNSCHPGGTADNRFFFPGISGAPGTSDISNALFHGPADNGLFDPLPIPSLHNLANKASYGTQYPKATLEDFIRDIIEREFGGEAKPWLVTALTRYLLALEPEDRMIPASAADDLDWLERYAWRLAQVRGNAEEHIFIAEATRAHIGRMAARFNGPEHKGVRALFVYWSQLLAQPPGGFGANVAILRETMEDTRDMIIEASQTSLYEKTPARLFLNERGLLR